MLLVAESGSTKTHWSLISPNSITELCQTQGINPVLQSIDEIETILQPIYEEVNLRDLGEIDFFGAGCASPALNNKVAQACLNVFKCQSIKVESDLIAACLALAGNNPGIIGLLGTGSNSCAWDGSKVDQQIPALGYILGDEGGGVSIGKQLIIDYLKNQMPQALQVYFKERYQLTKPIVVERVYQMKGANRYLASFAPFVDDFIQTEYCNSLVKTQFKTFMTYNILQYINEQVKPVFFCGSIANAHANLLTEVAADMKIEISKIIKEPIYDLSKYLQSNLKASE